MSLPFGLSPLCLNACENAALGEECALSVFRVKGVPELSVDSPLAHMVKVARLDRRLHAPACLRPCLLSLPSHVALGVCLSHRP